MNPFFLTNFVLYIIISPFVRAFVFFLIGYGVVSQAAQIGMEMSKFAPSSRVIIQRSEDLYLLI